MGKIKISLFEVSEPILYTITQDEDGIVNPITIRITIDSNKYKAIESFCNEHKVSIAEAIEELLTNDIENRLYEIFT